MSSDSAAQRAPWRTTRRWIAPVVLATVLAPIAVVYGTKWLAAADRGGQMPAEPFVIAGNLSYVGTNDAAAFLLTGPSGHVLIASGRPATAPMIIESIARLGADIREVRVLLTSAPHFEDAGGLAALQRASGAELWVSDVDAGIIAAGGVIDRQTAASALISQVNRGARMKAVEGAAVAVASGFVASTGIGTYAPPRIDHRFKDGDTIRLGPLALTAHVNPSCTSWSFTVHDGARELHAANVCDVSDLSVPFMNATAYPEVRKRFAITFARLRELPIDIFLATRARAFGRWRKFQARTSTTDPVAPFIDREGYLRFIDQVEERVRKRLAD